MMRYIALAAAVVLGATSVFAQTGEFQPVGIGGGGGMFTPMGSPVDPDFWLISSDMSGAYRSLDGGKTFEMMNWAEMRSCHTCRPCFVGNDVYWARGVRDLRVSHDKAKTWQDVTVGNMPWGGDRISRIAALETTPYTLFVSTGNALFRSGDAGRTREQVKPEGAQDVSCKAICALGTKVYASMAARLYKSDDSGRTWTALQVCAQEKPVSAIAGAKAKDGASVLFAVIGEIGVMQSNDEGKTWRLSDEWRNQKDVLVPSGQTTIAYAAQYHDVWRTLDAGKTWQACFFMSGAKKNVAPSFVQTDLFWGYSIMTYGLGVSLADPNVVMVSTQGDFYVSRNAGNSWDQWMSTPVGKIGDEPGYAYKSKGLEVTTTWDYYIDPSDANRHYIAYTDIGFARSPDGGESWISSVRGCPWSNTFYEIAFDPFVKGRIYAACSYRHDIPHWTQTDANKPSYVGCVCVSDDWGRSWNVLGNGLPKLPCTSICIDPKSTPDKLVMYTTLYEGGVYKSVDGGENWANMSRGLGNKGNLHALMVRVHPKTGSLFCSITAMRVGARDFPVPGGLWKSTDGGESWTDLTRDLKLHWANGFAIDPNDENVIYQTAATIPDRMEGGLYKTTDGGATWTRILKDADFGVAYVHGMFVALHPDDANKVYIGSSAGLRVSCDAGKTWKDFGKIPFRNVHVPTFDPKDPKVMWVTTFGGGVWKGPYLPGGD